MKLRNALTKPDDFCGRNASQRHHLMLQILTKSCQEFPRYEPSKLAEFLCLFFLVFSLLCQSVKFAVIKHKRVIRLPTQKGGIRVHRGTKFGCNTINGHKVINSCSQKKPLSCLQGKPMKISKER